MQEFGLLDCIRVHGSFCSHTEILAARKLLYAFVGCKEDKAGLLVLLHKKRSRFRRVFSIDDALPLRDSSYPVRQSSKQKA